MKTRLAAAALWFVSISSLGGFAEVFFGAPSEIGGYLGIAVALFVLVDPTGLAWGGRRGTFPISLRPRANAAAHTSSISPV